MKYEMTNSELRAAIEATVQQLQPMPFKPTLPESTRAPLENHLHKLLGIEAARASVVVANE